MGIFCDGLTVTFPSSAIGAAFRELREFARDLGATEERRSYIRFPGGSLMRLCEGTGGSWGSCEAKGSALAYLRSQNAYTGLLAALAGHAHQVTRLDAALDLLEDAPAHVARVYAMARAGKLRWGRKALSPRDLNHNLRPALYDPAIETGTAYVGQRGQRVMLRVYDKRNERLDKGELDLGPCTRFEFAYDKRMGCTLRDAEDPTALFWLHGQQVLQRPEGVPDWEAHGEGLAFPKRQRMGATERLQRACENSEALGNICQLALDLGDGGLDELKRLVTLRYRLAVATAAFRAASARAA